MVTIRLTPLTEITPPVSLQLTRHLTLAQIRYNEQLIRALLQRWSSGKPQGGDKSLTGDKSQRGHKSQRGDK